MCTCQYLIQFKVVAGLTGYVADVTDSSGSDKLKLDMYWCQCLLEHQLVCNFVLCHMLSVFFILVYFSWLLRHFIFVPCCPILGVYSPKMNSGS